MRVLVVEDYLPIRRSVRQALHEAGYAVDVTDDGEDALELASSESYDVIILDLMLPRMNGLNVLKELRDRNNSVHVLILTSKNSLDDRVSGLNIGADDYLTKPFELPELLARVQALVRRKYVAKSPILCVADLEINTITRTCRRGDKEIDLSAKEYAFLEFLALRQGQVVTRTTIWDHLYDMNTDVESNVIEVFISMLRRKIERPGLPTLIHTRRGHGYMLGD